MLRSFAVARARIECTILSRLYATDGDCRGENAMTTLLNHRQSSSPVANRSYSCLYRAVIRRAVQDLAQDELRDEAREWLLSSDSDFAFATAGISPMSIRQQMI